MKVTRVDGHGICMIESPKQLREIADALETRGVKGVTVVVSYNHDRPSSVPNPTVPLLEGPSIFKLMKRCFGGD